MKCQKCQHADTKVIESRDVGEGESTRRRRECPKCQARFTTYERLERPQLVVIKRDGSRQMYDRTKLISGMQRACEKTTISSLQIEAAVNRIENLIYGFGEPEIESEDLGELTMKELAKLSDVAYVRFASVYRRFSDVTGFEAELRALKNKNP